MSKKAIIWVSISAILIGGSIGGYLWWQNRPEKTDDNTNENEDEDSKLPDLSGGGTSSGGSSSGGSIGAGTTTSAPKLSSYDAVRKFYGSKGRSFDNRFVVTASASDFNKMVSFMGIQLAYGEDWGIGNKKIYMTYYKNGSFFLKIEGMDSWIISGVYSDGGKQLKVTDAKGKWAKNIGLIVDGNPAANVKEIAKIS